MSHIIIDKTLNPRNKSTANRRRFLDRVKERTKQTVKKAIADGSITDIVSDRSEKINVPTKDISEPTFQHDQGGVVERVFPGNKEFSPGDRIARPPGGGSGGGEGASDSGEGEDAFEFTISREEFLEYFFEDLELPDLENRDIATTEEFQVKRAGFVTEGDPGRLNIIRSMKNSTSRRIALRNPKKKKIKALELELKNLEHDIKGKPEDQTMIERDRIAAINAELAILRRKLKAVPFVDEIDLRFHNTVKVPVPTTQAVMFCIMDVSGSMGEWHKEMSKRFFMLLYLFLYRNYEKIDVVFIRHHTSAKEVDEDEFFHSRETGGTLVSPALELMLEIQKERYPTNAWNVYACQASDGDNWPQDNAKTVELINNSILPIVQYFAYVETNEHREGDLWPHYSQIANDNANFDIAKIADASDIYPVFRGLFKRG